MSRAPRQQRTDRGGDRTFLTRVWAWTGALLMAVRGWLLWHGGFSLQLFGVVLLAHGASSLWIGVGLQFGAETLDRVRVARWVVVHALALLGVIVAHLMASRP